MEAFNSEKVDLSYLQSEGIGKVVAKGLAALYAAKPKFPVDFLSKWLLSYQIQLENEHRMRLLEEQKSVDKEEYNKRLEQAQKEKDRI